MGETKDALGLAPYGEALKVATARTFDGASAFLSRICMPAAEEFGLLLRDRVSHWRAKNAAAIAREAEAMLESGGVQAHPRLVMRVIEDGSWTDDNVVQSMWAGLLASSCSADGRDESNLVFVTLLSQLTSSQVRILQFACKSATLILMPAGWIGCSGHVMVSGQELVALTGLTDLHRIDRELDHLRSLGLLDATGGFQNLMPAAVAYVTPSSLCLQLHARAHGFRGSPVEFYGLKENRSSSAVPESLG